MGISLEIDLDNIQEFVESEKFTQFLTSNTTNFGTAAFILQVVLDKVAELRKENSSLQNN